MEKPTGDRLEMLAHASKHASPEFPFEASMGIYVFRCVLDLLFICCLCKQTRRNYHSAIRTA